MCEMPLLHGGVEESRIGVGRVHVGVVGFTVLNDRRKVTACIGALLINLRQGRRDEKGNP